MSIISPLSRYFTVVVAGLIITGVSFQILPIVVTRTGTVLLLLAQIFVERRAGGNQFLTSPLFLLGAITLVFFSFIPGFFDPIFLPGFFDVKHFKNIDSFYGSDAERMFVIFGLGCLVIHALIADRIKMLRPPSKPDFNGGSKIIYIFSAIALGVLLVNTVNFISLKLGGPYNTTIRSVAPPLLAFCLIFLVYRTNKAPGRLKLLTAVVFVLSVAGLVFVFEGKITILLALAGALYLLRLENISLKPLIIFAAALALGAVVLLQVIQIVRMPDKSILAYVFTSQEQKRQPDPLLQPSALWTVINSKLVLRQTETTNCFHNVIDQHWEAPFSASRQLFWVKALVPRVFWPEKPSLSMGSQYAPKYCGLPGNATHSASISLLGQPVIYGGGLGLLIHGGILIGCLGGLMWIGRNPRSISSVTAVALLPWLIDFDQDFAQYAANAVKFFLVMLPLVFLAAKMERQPKPT